MPFDMYVQNQCCCVFAVFRGTSFWKMELWLMQKVQLRCVVIRCFSMFLCFCLHILQQLQLRHRTLHSIWWVVLTQECVLLPLWNLIVALLQWDHFSNQGDIDSVYETYEAVTWSLCSLCHCRATEKTHVWHIIKSWASVVCVMLKTSVEFMRLLDLTVESKFLWFAYPKLLCYVMLCYVMNCALPVIHRIYSCK